MSSMKMMLQVYGARRGSFEDEGRKVQYCAVYASNDLDSNDRVEAVGMSVEKFSADATAFDAIRTEKLPAWFTCDVEVKTGPQGSKIKIKNAKAMKAAA